MQRLRAVEIIDPEQGLDYWAVVVEDPHHPNLWVTLVRCTDRHDAYHSLAVLMHERAS